MGYELRYTVEVEDEITDFVLRFPEHQQDRVLGQIEDHLSRLAAHPIRASRPRGNQGPRYIFTLQVGGATYYVAIAFHYTHDERAIAIIGFQQLLF